MSLYLDTLQTLLLDDLYRPYDPKQGWPSHAMSMIGHERMTDLRRACETAVAEEVPGCFVETGIWRGGALAMMAAVVREHFIIHGGRAVVGFDSFAGVPRPYSMADAGLNLHAYKHLAVSRDVVEANLKKLGLLDRVKLVEGWFKDTVPAMKSDVGPIAVLRLDGDLYTSTMEVLTELEPQVSPGGFIIIDDYGIPQCARAVEEYRASAGITTPMNDSEGGAKWWRK